MKLKLKYTPLKDVFLFLLLAQHKQNFKNQYKTVNKEIMGWREDVSTNVETRRVCNGVGRPGLKLLMPSGSR